MQSRACYLFYLKPFNVSDFKIKSKSPSIVYKGIHELAPALYAFHDAAYSHLVFSSY